MTTATQRAAATSANDTAGARLRCISCGAEYGLQEVVYHCASCGDLLDVVYDYPAYEPESLKRQWLARRTSLLPIDQSGVWR